MAKQIPIDILAHADFSGRLKQTRRSPGLAAFGSLVDSVRDKNPQGTLFLDAGDEFSAGFWGGGPVVQALALLGTDAMALGNHEFDRGKAVLDSCIAQADYPILCANITEKATGALIPGVKPWVITEKSGLQIGVLGLTTEYTPYMVTAASFEPYQVHSCADACRTHIPRMREAGAQIVVVLSHLPFYVDANGAISGELYDVLTNIPPVDVFIGGHIPGDYAAVVNDTVVLKGGFAGLSLCHARLWYCPETERISGRECRVLHTDVNAPVNPVYRDYADCVTAPYRDFFEEVLATTDETWEIRLSQETRLGNLMADCVREAAGTDIAYMNATSAGGTISPGEVTAEDVTSVMGFNDPIMRARIRGEQIWQLFELVYEPERYGNNAGLFYSGLVVHVDHTRPAFQKIQSITLRDGTPIERNQTYTVASSEYMASGGNDTSLVANALEWENTQVLMHDGIFAYLRKHGELHVSPEQRMYAVGRPENDNAPF